MFNSFFLVLGFVFVFFIIDNFFRTIRDQMTLILIDTCKVTYRSKGPGVFIYCKLNILHILYIITHVTIIKHLLTYLLTYYKMKQRFLRPNLKDCTDLSTISFFFYLVFFLCLFLEFHIAVLYI